MRTLILTNCWGGCLVYVKSPNCRYYCYIALTANVFARIQALRRVLVPAARSRVKACLPLPAAPIWQRGHITEKLFHFCATGNMEREERKEEKACQNADVPESQHDEEKRRKEKKCGWAWPYYHTMRWRIADLSWSPTSAVAEAHTNPGNWAATLATSSSMYHNTWRDTR